MKSVAAILTLLILFIAIQPAVESMSVESDSICCETACMPVSDNQQVPLTDNESNGLCNPFMQCSFCVMFVGSLTTFIPKSGFPDSKIKQFYQSRATSQYSFDFWHPPKIG